MPLHLRRQHPLRRYRRYLHPQQRRIPHLQTLLIASLCAIIPHRPIRPPHHRPTHRRIPIEHRLRRRIAHPVSPEIVHLPRLPNLRRHALRIRIALQHKDLRQARIHRQRIVPRIHERNNPIPTRQFPNPARNTTLTIPILRSRIRIDLIRRAPLRILAHGQHRRIGIDAQRLGRHIPDVGADNQRALEDGPHAEVQHVLGVAHAAVADLQHVEVVPRARLRFGDQGRGLGQDVGDGAVEAGEGAVVGRAGAGGVRAGEGVVHVAGDAPAVGHGLGPVPGVVLAPVAN